MTNEQLLEELKSRLYFGEITEEDVLKQIKQAKADKAQDKQEIFEPID